MTDPAASRPTGSPEPEEGRPVLVVDTEELRRMAELGVDGDGVFRWRGPLAAVLTDAADEIDALRAALSGESEAPSDRPSIRGALATFSDNRVEVRVPQADGTVETFLVRRATAPRPDPFAPAPRPDPFVPAPPAAPEPGERDEDPQSIGICDRSWSGEPHAAHRWVGRCMGGEWLCPGVPAAPGEGEADRLQQAREAIEALSWTARSDSEAAIYRHVLALLSGEDRGTADGGTTTLPVEACAWPEQHSPFIRPPMARADCPACRRDDVASAADGGTT